MFIVRSVICHFSGTIVPCRNSVNIWYHTTLVSNTVIIDSQTRLVPLVQALYLPRASHCQPSPVLDNSTTRQARGQTASQRISKFDEGEADLQGVLQRADRFAIVKTSSGFRRRVTSQSYDASGAHCVCPALELASPQVCFFLPKWFLAAGGFEIFVSYPCWGRAMLAAAVVSVHVSVGNTV